MGQSPVPGVGETLYRTAAAHDKVVGNVGLEASCEPSDGGVPPLQDLGGAKAHQTCPGAPPRHRFLNETAN